MTITGKRKLPGKNQYKEILPEIIKLEKTLKNHQLNQKKLIAIGILVGTDYNDGIKGIGPKRALKLAKEYDDISEINKEEIDDEFEVDPSEVEELFLNPRVKDDYEIEWENPDPTKIKEFLCEEHDFSESRVETGIDRLKKGKGERAQQSLKKWG